jgi:phage gp36-like protein
MVISWPTFPRASYATSEEFDTHGINPAGLPAGITNEQKAGAIVAASTLADGYLCGRFTMPLTAWGVDLTQAVCKIAVCDLMAAQVGFNPDEDQGKFLMGRRAEAVRWLEQVSRGAVTPMGITDSRPSSTPGGAAPSARAFSLPSRGWVRRRD